MTIRQLALVEVEKDMIAWLRNNGHGDSPLLKEKVFVYLGEIPNMPEHCVVAGQESGRVYSGFHSSNFTELIGDALVSERCVK